MKESLFNFVDSILNASSSTNSNPPTDNAPQTTETKTAESTTTSAQSINYKNAKGFTALHKAIRSPNTTEKFITSLLNDPGININEKSDDGHTPLHLAVKNQNEQWVKLLLEKKASITIGDAFNNTPLHLAVRENNQVIVELLAQPLAINKINNAGETALHRAVRASKEDNVKLLLDKNANVNLATAQSSVSKLPSLKSGKSSALHFALSGYHINSAIVTLLIDKKAFPDYANENGKTAAYLALAHAEIAHLTDEQLTYLLSNAATQTVTHDKLSVLHAAATNTAVSKEKFIIVLNKVLALNRFIIDAQDNHGNTALYAAVVAANDAKVTLLIYKGANPNICEKKPPLCKAAQTKQTKIAQKLLIAGANPNATDSFNNSPLYYAALNNDVALIKTLSESKADFTGEEGKKAVNVALLNNHIEALTLLIQNEASADVHVSIKSASDSSFSTSSISSSSSCNSGTETKDKTGVLRDGDTPSHFAARTNNVVLAKACMDQDKKLVNSTNAKGRTPALVALKTLNQEVAQLLFNSGAKIDTMPKCSLTRANTFLMQGGQRGFDDMEQIIRFFKDPSFKLSPEQEKIRKEINAQYKAQPANTPKDFGKLGKSRHVLMPAPASSTSSTSSTSSMTVASTSVEDNAEVVESTTSTAASI